MRETPGRSSNPTSQTQEEPICFELKRERRGPLVFFRGYSFFDKIAPMTLSDKLFSFVIVCGIILWAFSLSGPDATTNQPAPAPGNARAQDNSVALPPPNKPAEFKAEFLNPDDPMRTIPCVRWAEVHLRVHDL